MGAKLAANCRYCGERKEKHLKQHERMCKSNPGREGGRKITGREVAPTPAKAKAMPQATVIEVQQQVIPEASLPKFDPPKQQAPQAQQGGLPPGPGQIPGLGSSADVMRPLIDFLAKKLDERADEAEGVEKRKELSKPEPIKPEDRQALATVYGMLLDKHLPAAFLQKWGLEVSALVLTGAIVVPKLFEYRAYWKYKKAQLEALKEARAESRGVSGVQFQAPEARPPTKQSPDEALKDRYEAALARSGFTGAPA